MQTPVYSHTQTRESMTGELDGMRLKIVVAYYGAEDCVLADHDQRSFQLKSYSHSLM
jgi:hypothetical protein